MALAPRAGAIRVLIAGQAILGAGIALFNLQSLSLRQAITPAGCSGASTRWCAWSAGEPSRSVRLSAAGSAG